MKQKTNFLKYKLMLLLISCSFILYAQKPEPAFKTYFTGMAFTSIAVDQNKNVWAGTTQQGLFFLNQTAADSIFKLQNIGTSPTLSSLRIQSLAADKSGNIWVGHGGTNTSNWSGGAERINTNTFEVQHLSPDADANGLSYVQRDGLGTLNAQQVVVDINNRVWIAHRYHDLTVLGPPTSHYYLTPGTFSSRMADDYTGRFNAVSTWKDRIDKNEDIHLPYPAYTYDPPINKTAQARVCNAISTDNNFVWVSVYAYEVHLTGENLPARLLQYSLDGKFVAQYSIGSVKFPKKGGVFNGVYANNAKGVWATSSLADNGFSVLKEGRWYNIYDSKIIPPGTRFNQKAIWGDVSGRVYLGTNNGLIIYDGTGPVDSVNSYTLYTKEPYGISPRSIHKPDMLSNNIIAGVPESNKNPFYSWIATDSGIMKSFLPAGDVIAYHVNDKNIDYNTKEFYDDNNLIPFAQLNNPGQYLPREEELPVFAADGTTSTLFRYYTKDAASFYNGKYGLEIGYYLRTILPEKPGTEGYKARYGEFFPRPLETYGNNVNLDDLEYVDFVYKHPVYINSYDFSSSDRVDTGYPYFMLYIKDNEKKPSFVTVFDYPVKFSLPPVLLGHGVWSSIKSMDKIEDYLLTKGYSKNEILKAWRIDDQLPENPYEKDAPIIPSYINRLKIKALEDKISAGKVNVIVHSRGGLYTRAYIEEIDPKYKYNNDINLLITLNTPHAGSQNANAVLDKRIAIPKIYIPEDPYSFPIILNDLDNVPYTTVGPFTVGDLFQLPVPDKGDKQKTEDGKGGELWGARNLMVVKDDISGSHGAPNDFIEKLNTQTNLQKLQDAQVPIHAIATNFSFCKTNSAFCNEELLSNLTTRGKSADLNTILVYKSLKFLLEKTNTIVKGLDGFMTYLFNGETNDFIVPNSSEKAGLPSPYFSSLETQNAPHTDPFLGLFTGVCADPVVHKKIFDLIREDLRLSDNGGSFTKTKLNPPPLTYNFLSETLGAFSENKRIAQNPTGKIVINPNSFTSEMTPGNNANFDVYQENLDSFIIMYNYPGLEDQYLYIKDKEITFKNNLSFTIPKEFFGKFSVTAYGFSQGQLVAMHTVEPTVQLPSGLTLQNIRFEQQEDSMPEQSSYSFNLLGTFSDGVERRINDMTGITYTIDDPRILKKADNQTIKSLIPGTTIFTASINSLTATLTMNVEQDLMLQESIVTDFYPEYEKTGSIKLTWDTYQEYQSKNFTLERSENNNQNFTLINQQTGKGTYYNPSSYNFSDNTNSDHVFYRLKLYNTDNQEVYNQIIEVNRKTLSVDETKPANKEDKLVLAPNPVKTSTGNLFIKSDFNDNQAVLNIYDISGRLVYTKKYTITPGEQKISFDIPSGISNGVYLVQLRTKSYAKSTKLVLQR